MKAITLWQPFASLWAAGIKQYETRHWACPWQGPLAIHAGKKQDYDTLQYFLVDPTARAAFRELAEKLSIKYMAQLPWGAIVGVCAHVISFHTGYVGQPSPAVAGLTDRERAVGNYSPGRWLWVPVNMRMLPQPVPCQGAQHIWDLPPDVEAEVRRQLGGMA